MGLHVSYLTMIAVMKRFQRRIFCPEAESLVKNRLRRQK